MKNEKTTVGFIGCGNMGGALARAVAKTTVNAALLLCDAAKEKAEALAKEIGAETADAAALISRADVVVVGVKPQVLGAALAPLKDEIGKKAKRTLYVTMAAGVSIADFRAYAGTDVPVIRIMPNTPAAIGKGTVLYTSADVTEEEKQLFLALFANAGILDPIAEDKIDAAAALSGCGPAFVYMFAEALADGAVACGLARDKALLYAASTVEGAAAYLRASGKHPGELKDAVCSPGGTTIEGVRTLEENAFRGTVMDAVIAAYEKTKNLK